MSGVGTFLKADEYTLSRGKGKFARVCLNVDVTKALRGTWTIPTSEAILSLPISYEGLHEVCAICGSTNHALDTCPNSPQNVFEVIVEKFGVTTLQPDSVTTSHTSGAKSQLPPENWVTVSPKKRSRIPNSYRKSGMPLTPARFTAPKVNIIPSPTNTPTVAVSDTFSAGGAMGATSGPTFGPTTLHTNSWEAKKSQTPPVLSNPEVDLPIDDEDNMDIFLNPEGDEDPQLSSESSKK